MFSKSSFGCVKLSVAPKKICVWFKELAIIQLTLINRSAQMEDAKANFILTFFVAMRLVSQLMQKSLNLLKSRKLQENQLSPVRIMSSKTPKMEEIQNIPKVRGKNFSTSLHVKTISHLKFSKLILYNQCTHCMQYPWKTCRREPVNSIVSLLP